jgi:hypothetical protein
MATITSADSAPVKAISREPEIATFRTPVAPVAPEPERRLWKLSSDVLSSGHGWIGNLIFVMFAVVAALATINCFFQLLRLLNDASINDVVKFLLR